MDAATCQSCARRSGTHESCDGSLEPLGPNRRAELRLDNGNARRNEMRDKLRNNGGRWSLNGSVVAVIFGIKLADIELAS
jgi:hypothetical protein